MLDKITISKEKKLHKTLIRLGPYEQVELCLVEFQKKKHKR